MADKKISDFTAATSLDPSDLFEIENTGGNSRKVTLSTLRKAVGRTLITETVTSGSATNVSFASIPADYRDLELRVRGRGTKAATLVDIRVRFNGDTGANYDAETQQANNTTNSNFASAGTTSLYVGNIAAASAPANVADYVEAVIADYRSTTFQKAGRYLATLKTAASAAGVFNESGSIWWRSTSAITQIDVFPSANAFVDGTVISLYGLL
jgi:hypothetical protein